MAFSKITKDMNIIAALDDEPNDVGGLSAAQLKAKFDEGGLALKTFINNWIDAIAAGTAAANIGAKDGNDNDTTLQTALDNLAGAVIGTLPDGSVTTAKLHDGAVTDAKIDWSTSGILRCETLSWVGNNTYGAGNETVMAFTHEPKLVYISQRNGGNVNTTVSTSLLDWNALEGADAEAGTPAIAVTYNDTEYYCNYSITGNTLKLWHSTDPTLQYNANNFVYYALAIY